jgi:tetratricopeptide (TPR) repeat protein
LRQLGGAEDTLARFTAESPAASPAAWLAQSEAVAEVVRSVASNAPLVVVLDDLQWVDGASIRILSFVASAIRDVGCLVIGTYRTGELDRDHVAELARVGVTLAVPALSDDEARELLRSAAGTSLSSGPTEAVVERAGGNPLFVWEFGQLMAQSGRFDVAPAAVPDAVTAVIERRLARLSEADIAVLRVGAVAGNPFSAELVATAGDLAPADVALALGAAARVGLIMQVDPKAGFRFSHDVVRDVVLDGIDLTRLSDLHLRVAATFAARVATDESLHAVVADHLEHAGSARAEEAAAHWERAAVHARNVLAYEDAARCVSRARSGPPSDPLRQATLFVDEGDCLLLAGRLDAARARFREAARIARTVREPEVMARAVLGMGTGAVAWEVPLANDEQAALVSDALELLPDDEIALRSMLLARLSVTAARPETMAAARTRAAEALALAERTGDRALVAQALAAVNDAIAGPAHAIQRRDNADLIVELAGAVGDRVLEILGYRFRIVADLELGDLASVDRAIADFSRLAEQLRQPLVSWYVPLFRGMRALLAGDIESADRHRREVAAAAAETGSHNALMLGVTLQFGIDMSTGRHIDPDGLDGIVDVEPAEWASFAAGLAMMKFFGGQPDRARTLLRLHADNGFSRVGEDSEQLTTLLMFSRVAIELGERAAAQSLYELLAPHADLWVVDGIAACCWGPVELVLGQLALALDRPVDARGHLSRARASAERAGARLLLEEVEALEPRAAPSDALPPSHLAPRETITIERGADGDLFRCEGQFWTLTYRGRTVRMRDAKGLHDIARLLARPGQEIHVLELAGVDADRESAAIVRATRDTGELLDARARAEYRRRLGELEDELADAERCADIVRAEKAASERDFIAAELAAALGLDGRPRRAGDPIERARKTVSARIRLTIGRIEGEHPELARHLANAVRTGTTCSYEPEHAMLWSV